MPPLIYLLLPKTYYKKPCKSSVEFQDVDNFLVELQRKIVDCWNYEFQVDNCNGSGYKIKFDQFEKKFLKKSDFVFYIVCSLSVEPFRNCIGKILKSCKESEKLSRIVVLSLDTPVFEELKDTKIELVYFGDAWKSENSDQWNVLDNILKSKIKGNLHEDETLKTDSLPIPNSNCGRKSPSKFKTFFNSLPARFDANKGKGLLSPKAEKYFNQNNSGQDIRLPNINVSDVENSKHDNNTYTMPRRQKVDSTKLSLNSLFRRHSKKTRDSGLSIDSSTSTGSGSRKSETIVTRGSLLADDLLEDKPKTLSESGQLPVILVSSLRKTEIHKAKIEFFKEKASKAIRSTNCLKSPKDKKRVKCDVNEVLSDVVDFSSGIMTASSNIGNQSEKILNRKNNLIDLLNDRGQSEPREVICRNVSDDSIANRRIKYYSWNEDSNEENASTVDELLCNDSGIPYSISNNLIDRNVMESDQATSDLGTSNGISYENLDKSSEMLHHNLNHDEYIYTDKNIMNPDDSDVFYTTFKPSNSDFTLGENPDENIINNDVSEVSYSTFIPSGTTPYHNDSVKNTSGDSGVSPGFEMEETDILMLESEKYLQNDPMESLDRLIKSIQISCAEQIISRKNQNCNMEIHNDNDEGNISGVANSEAEMLNESEKISAQRESVLNANPVSCDNNLPINKFLSDADNQKTPITPQREMSPELIAVADSITSPYHSPTSSIRSTCQTVMRNPIFVSGLLAATTITAPMWSTFIPRHMCLSKLFYGTLDFIFYSNIGQLVPNRTIFTGRGGVSVATHTVKRILIALPYPWA